MNLSKPGVTGFLFGALALAGCRYDISTESVEIPADLTCTSAVLDQTIEIKEGERLSNFNTVSHGEPYYLLKRQSEERTQEGAVETIVETEINIKMYDHDRWQCADGEGNSVDYKFPAAAP